MAGARPPRTVPADRRSRSFFDPRRARATGRQARRGVDDAGARVGPCVDAATEIPYRRRATAAWRRMASECYEDGVGSAGGSYMPMLRTLYVTSLTPTASAFSAFAQLGRGTRPAVRRCAGSWS